MNRRERKSMERQLGLQKFYKSMSRQAKFEKMKNNIENGKKMEEEFKQKVQLSIQRQDEEKESAVISSLAESIIKHKKIAFIDAIEEAKEMYLNIKK